MFKKFVLCSDELFIELIQLAANANWLHWSLSNPLARSVCMWILPQVFWDIVDIKVATWLSSIFGRIIFWDGLMRYHLQFLAYIWGEKKKLLAHLFSTTPTQYCPLEVIHGWFCSYVPMFGETEYDPARQFSSVDIEEQLDALGRAVDAGKVSDDIFGFVSIINL